MRWVDTPHFPIRDKDSVKALMDPSEVSGVRQNAFFVWVERKGSGKHNIFLQYDEVQDAAEAAAEIKQAWEEWREKR